MCLPQVCKLWRDLTAGPSSVWTDIDVSFSLIGAYRIPRSWELVTAWFARRSPSTSFLAYSNTGERETHSPGSVNVLEDVVQLAHGLRATLQTIRVVGESDTVTARCFASLAATAGLTSLTLRYVVLDPSQLDSLSSLRRLAVLRLR